MKLGRTNKGVAGASGKKRNGQGALSEFYDSKAGIITATALTLILWWVPYLGPMAAGFMGGRKGGSLVRGIFVGAVSCVLVVAIATVVSVGVSGLVSLFGGAISEAMPVLYGRILDFQVYLDSLVVVSGTSISVEPSSYFLMLALSVIGGAYADQSREEVIAIAALVKEVNQAPVPRSMKAHAEKRPMDFRTYEDYARMSINVTAAADPRPQPEMPRVQTPVAASVPAGAPASSQVYPGTPVVIEQTQAAAATVTMTSSQEHVPAAVPESGSEPVQRRDPKDDYEFL